MNTIGIIAEYNPFHRGHLAQYKWIREKIGENTAIVVALAAPICQRGLPALQSPQRRAENAIKLGADLVLAVPQIYSVSSAESYATAGVYLLAASGLVQMIAASSEIFDKNLLDRAADFISPESEKTKNLIQVNIKAGLSPHQARSKAIAEQSSTEIASCFDYANARLCVEYLRALRCLPSGIKAPGFFLCPRQETNIDDENSYKQASASDIRAFIEEAFKSSKAKLSSNGKAFNEALPIWEIEKLKTLKKHLPAQSLASLIFDLQNKQILLESSYLRYLHLLILQAEPEETSKFRYMQNGLAERLANCSKNTNPLSEAQSLNFPKARIQRALTAMALGITEEVERAAGSYPAYAQVLAFNKNGRYLLRKRAEQSKIPLISKFSDTQRILSSEAKSQAIIDRRAASLRSYLIGAIPSEEDLLKAPLRL